MTSKKKKKAKKPLVSSLLGTQIKTAINEEQNKVATIVTGRTQQMNVEAVTQAIDNMAPDAATNLFVNLATSCRNKISAFQALLNAFENQVLTTDQINQALESESLAPSDITTINQQFAQSSFFSQDGQTSLFDCDMSLEVLAVLIDNYHKFGNIMDARGTKFKVDKPGTGPITVKIDRKQVLAELSKDTQAKYESTQAEFQKLQEAYDKLQEAHTKLKSNRLSAQELQRLKASAAQADQLQAQVNNLTKQIAEQSSQTPPPEELAELQSAAQQNVKLTEDLQAKSTRVTELEQEIANLQEQGSNIKLLTAWYKTKQAEIEQIDQIKAAKERAEKNLEQVQSQRQDLLQEKANFQKKIRELQETLSKLPDENKWQQTCQEYSEKTSQIEQLQNTLQEQSQAAEEQTQLVQEFQSQLEQHRKTEQDLTAKLQQEKTELNTKIQTQSDNLKELQKSNKALKDESANSQAQLQTQKQQIARLQQAIEARKLQLTIVPDLTDDTAPDFEALYNEAFQKNSKLEYENKLLKADRPKAKPISEFWFEYIIILILFFCLWYWAAKQGVTAYYGYIISLVSIKVVTSAWKYFFSKK